MAFTAIDQQGGAGSCAGFSAESHTAPVHNSTAQPSGFPQQIPLADVRKELYESEGMRQKHSQKRVIQLQGLSKGLCRVVLPDGRAAMAVLFGNTWLVTGCHVILTAQMLNGAEFSFFHLDDGPLHLVPSESTQRQGWYMWKDKDAIKSSVPDMAVLYLPELQQHQDKLAMNSFAPLVNGSYLANVPPDSVIHVVLSYGDTLLHPTPEMQVSRVRMYGCTQRPESTGRFSKAVELCSATFEDGASGSYVVAQTIEGVHDPGASHLVLGKPADLSDDSSERCILQISAVNHVLNLLQLSINDRLSSALRQKARDDLDKIREPLPDDDFDAYIPFGRGLHPVKDEKERCLVQMMLGAWQKEVEVVDSCWTYGKCVFSGESVEAIQDYAEDKFSKADAWKWQSIRFDVQSPVSNKDKLRKYQNIVLQMGPKIKNNPTEKEKKEGNSLVAAILPCGPNPVLLNGQKMTPQAYASQVFQKSFAATEKMDQRTELEKGEKLLQEEQQRLQESGRLSAKQGKGKENKKKQTAKS